MVLGASNFKHRRELLRPGRGFGSTFGRGFGRLRQNAQRNVDGFHGPGTKRVVTSTVRVVSPQMPTLVIR